MNFEQTKNKNDGITEQQNKNTNNKQNRIE